MSVRAAGVLPSVGWTDGVICVVHRLTNQVSEREGFYVVDKNHLSEVEATPFTETIDVSYKSVIIFSSATGTRRYRLMNSRTDFSVVF